MEKESIPAIIIKVEGVRPSATKGVSIFEVMFADLSQAPGSEDSIGHVVYSGNELPNGFRNAEVVFYPAPSHYDEDRQSNIPLFFCIRRDVIGLANGGGGTYSTPPIRPRQRGPVIDTVPAA